MKLHSRGFSSKSKVRERGLKKRGRGLLNKLINNLPFEFHIPSYRYCGPGTNLQKRLERGDLGKNPLDEACKEHDIAYNKFSTLEERHAADKILQDTADERAKADDATIGEKIAANIVRAGMRIKRKLGAGVRRKRGGGAGTKKKDKARKPMKKGGNVKRSRKRGGFLFPAITTALTAYKTLKDLSTSRKALAQQKQQNEVLERIAKGKGLYLKPYRGGGKRRKGKKSNAFLV